MEPSEAIETGENVLRSIVREILGDRWQQLITEKDLASTVERRTLEPRQRPGALETDDLLSYTDTGVLSRLILEQWSLFGPVFGNRDRAKVSFNAFVAYRRRVAHSRPLLPFERDLLSGLSGQFRNQVSLYRQKSNPNPGFFTSIDTSADSEGRPGSRETFSLDATPIIRAGETLVFSATATDPRGREIEWSLQIAQHPGGMHVFIPMATGERVELRWTPKPEEFSAVRDIYLMARNRSGYHGRSRGYDDLVAWSYTFEPPYE